MRSNCPLRFFVIWVTKALFMSVWSFKNWFHPFHGINLQILFVYLSEVLLDFWSVIRLLKVFLQIQSIKRGSTKCPFHFFLGYWLVYLNACWSLCHGFYSIPQKRNLIILLFSLEQGRLQISIMVLDQFLVFLAMIMFL